MKSTALCFAFLLLIMFAKASGCMHPIRRCQCGWSSYPCANGFSYGCKGGYCWSQCAALLLGCWEWCWVKSEATGNYLRCSSNADCRIGTDCGQAECSGRCSIIRKDYISDYLDNMAMESSKN